MFRSSIDEAKVKLSLVAVMYELGLGAHAKKSARCPFHDDEHPSFSVFKNKSAAFVFKCHACGAAGDQIDFIERYKNISRGEAIKLFLEKAGVRPSASQRKSSNGSKPFDWQQCGAELRPKDVVRLGNERWYSRDFCSWLREKKLVGSHNGSFAFPVGHNGTVVGAHYRLEDGSWRYHPQGIKTAPLIIGDLSVAKRLHVLESQFDAFALADRTDLYQDANVAFIATRGAGNAALVKGLIPENASVCAWPQNDAAGEKWYDDLTAHAGAKVARAVVPKPFKDVNEWTSAGASAEDIFAVLFRNELVEPSSAVEAAKPPTFHTDDQEARIHELAMLPPLEYDKVRKAEAEQLGIRVTTLDAEIDKLRPKQASSALQGREVDFAEVDPWPEAVSGAGTLSKVAEALCRYVLLPAGAADALALWCAHVHVFTTFLCSPRLNISSPEKGCGKTTLRNIIALFVPRPVLIENMSVAVLFRIVDAHIPTILADEYDAWLSDNEELRGLFNAGHRRGASVFRCEGEKNEVRRFAAYAPAVLCGIGALPGTLHDRSIVVRLDRAKPGELHDRFDSRHTENEQDLCRKLARWALDSSARLRSVDPVLPDGVFNRLADNWRPLFAIAEVAGAIGRNVRLTRLPK
jgi:CHC2 zinc finger/Protein of unknown function (DUF3631)